MKFKALHFEDALDQLIRQIGPVRLHTLRFFVSQPVEELAEALSDLENSEKNYQSCRSSA